MARVEAHERVEIERVRGEFDSRRCELTPACRTLQDEVEMSTVRFERETFGRVRDRATQAGLCGRLTCVRVELVVLTNVRVKAEIVRVYLECFIYLFFIIKGLLESKSE